MGAASQVPALEIWAVNLDAGRTPAPESALSQEERERAARTRSDEDRRRYVASHLWLRVLVGERLHLEPARVAFDHARRGKPSVAGGGSALSFSMSRSGPFGLYALSRLGAVGVDVEEHAEPADLGALERRFLAPAEATLVGRFEGLERRRQFFRFWSRKEAFLKALGVGLEAPWTAVDTSGTTVALSAEAGHLPTGGHLWTVADLPVAPSCSAAVSTAAGAYEEVPSLRWLSPA